MGRYDPMKPGEIRDFDYRQNQLMMMYYNQDAVTMNCSHVLDNRLAAIPNGKRDWALLRSLSRRLIEKILMTVPDKRMRQYEQLRKYGKVFIKIDPTGMINDSTDLIVSGDDYNMIVSTAIESQCATCMLQGKDINRCKLRQALVNCVPPKETCAYGCEYNVLARILMDESEDEDEGGHQAWKKVSEH